MIDVLRYMIDTEMISTSQNIKSIDYDTGIKIKINPQKFDHTDRWGKLTYQIFDKITQLDTKISKDAILLTFLYVNSFIGTKSSKENRKSNPCAFYRNINSMATEIGMSKETLINSLNILIDEKILIKRIVGSIKKEDKPPQNVPNIYVLNQPGYQEEIDMALEKMKELYSVDSFLPPTKTTLKKGNE